MHQPAPSVLATCTGFIRMLEEEAANMTLAELESLIRFGVVSATITRCHGNQCHAARELGIHRNTLNRIRRECIRRGMPDPVMISGKIPRKKNGTATGNLFDQRNRA